MTARGKRGTVVNARIREGLSGAIWLVGIVAFTLLFSDCARRYTSEGLRLAVITVLPSAIPSMLLSDLYQTYGAPERIFGIGRAFRMLFGINESGLRAYILGNLCGFPIGARSVAECYKSGMLTKEESERLLALSSSPSVAFLVGGVGLGMLGDIRLGILMLTGVQLANLLVGALSRKKASNITFSGDNIRQSYSLVESIKGVGASSLTVCAFIISFSVITGFARELIKNETLSALILMLTEVTGGVNYLCGLTISLPTVRYALIAFTLGFGGVCVMLQNKAMCEGTDLSLLPYFKLRLCVALLAMLITPLLIKIFIR